MSGGVLNATSVDIDANVGNSGFSAALAINNAGQVMGVCGPGGGTSINNSDGTFLYDINTHVFTDLAH